MSRREHASNYPIVLEFVMIKLVMTILGMALPGALMLAGEGGTMFQFNDQRFELKHAYAFEMETPDFEAMTPEDFQGGPEKMKWKKALAIALSDQPFDTQALAKADPPFEALDRMVEGGAALITVAAGKNGGVDMVRVSLPRSTKALELDTKSAELTLEAPKGGKLGGRLVIKGDRKMHEFDPEHVPYIEADIRFVAVVPPRHTERH